MVCWKSSIGQISSKISARPDLPESSSRPSARRASTRAFHFSLPSSQSKLSVCRARRLGTSRGSRIFAKLMRGGAVLLVRTESVGGLAGVARRGQEASFRGLADL